MFIPFIYILFIAEATLIFFVLSIILAIILYRNSKNKPASITTEDESRVINLGSSYIEHLETEIMKNNAQTKIETRIEHDDQGTPEPNDHAKKHSKLLKMRDLFLNTERVAAEHVENDILFWDHIYDGMKNILEHYKSVIHEATVTSEASV